MNGAERASNFHFIFVQPNPPVPGNCYRQIVVPTPSQELGVNSFHSRQWREWMAIAPGPETTQDDVKMARGMVRNNCEAVDRLIQEDLD
jgi:hypothetical protein